MVLAEVFLSALEGVERVASPFRPSVAVGTQSEALDNYL